MQTAKLSWPKSLKRFLLVLPIGVGLLAIYGMMQLGTVPKEWKGWLLLTFIVAPCALLIESLSAISLGWIEKRFGGVAVLGFFLASGIIGIALACHFTTG